MEDVQEITLLSFQIQEDTFAVDALKVDHILEVPENITPVPNAPEFIKGIINLHGNIIPVADMRIIMGKEDITSNQDNSIIVINPANNQDARVGIMVDIVKEVIETKSSELKETVLDGKKGLIESFEGTLLINDEFIHIIDMNNLAEIIEK
ncbi:chemotaxis protein CheW [Natronoflexus pectinivorans]|uniref:Purine-binding chemotaxis protein CheW n=1 Tax=Natronoflexus pectinivorans TaxID=682526 RepID=A0A4R2GRX8_9BACT|nr:purine-binding chemotaxis protein CheW [Natronoflexus pectinivorans]